MAESDEEWDKAKKVNARLIELIGMENYIIEMPCESINACKTGIPPIRRGIPVFSRQAEKR